MLFHLSFHTALHAKLALAQCSLHRATAMSEGVLKSWAEDAALHLEEHAIRLSECDAETVKELTFFGSREEDDENNMRKKQQHKNNKN